MGDSKMRDENVSSSPIRKNGYLELTSSEDDSAVHAFPKDDKDVEIRFVLSLAPHGPVVTRRVGYTEAYAECIIKNLTSEGEPGDPQVAVASHAPSAEIGPNKKVRCASGQASTPGGPPMPMEDIAVTTANMTLSPAATTQEPSRCIAAPSAPHSSRVDNKRHAPTSDADSNSESEVDAITVTWNTKPWVSEGSLVAADARQVREFFTLRFAIIGQNSCKQIHQALLEAIFKSRQNIFPYHGLPKRGRYAANGPAEEASASNPAPPFWPSNLRWEGSHRMNKRERVAALTHLFTLPLVMYDQCQLIIGGTRYGLKYESWGHLLGSIITPSLTLTDLERSDDGNQLRHDARLSTLKELIRVAGELEAWVERGRADANLTISFECVPEDIFLTYTAVKKRNELPQVTEEMLLRPSKRPTLVRPAATASAGAAHPLARRRRRPTLVAPNDGHEARRAFKVEPDSSLARASAHDIYELRDDDYDDEVEARAPKAEPDLSLVHSPTPDIFGGDDGDAMQQALSFGLPLGDLFEAETRRDDVVPGTTNSSFDSFDTYMDDGRTAWSTDPTSMYDYSPHPYLGHGYNERAADAAALFNAYPPFMGAPPPPPPQQQQQQHQQQQLMQQGDLQVRVSDAAMMLPSPMLADMDLPRFPRRWSTDPLYHRMPNLGRSRSTEPAEGVRRIYLPDRNRAQDDQVFTIDDNNPNSLICLRGRYQPTMHVSHYLAAQPGQFDFPDARPGQAEGAQGHASFPLQLFPDMIMVPAADDGLYENGAPRGTYRLGYGNAASDPRPYFAHPCAPHPQ